MDKPPEVNKENTERPERTIEELENMIEILDMEIVREGEKINPNKLKQLTMKKGVFAKEVAILKGEPIDKRLVNE